MTKKRKKSMSAVGKERKTRKLKKNLTTASERKVQGPVDDGKITDDPVYLGTAIDYDRY